MDETTTELELPGFRFHPTEEELLDFYLKNMIFGKGLPVDIIRVVNIYRHDPWELPGLARLGEREWYFFVPRDRKHGSGGRPNRTTEHGFWKATGSDRKIVSLSGHKRVLGLRKTLVFYNGRAPRGSKTDWVMNEYRLPDNSPLPKDMVLCKIYRKATSLKVLEQRAAMEEEMKNMNTATSPISSPMETNSFFSQYEDSITRPILPLQNVSLKKEKEEEEDIFTKFDDERGVLGEEFKLSSSLKLPLGKEINLTELQVPKIIGDWTQDAFWTQFNSPWFQNLNLASALNS